MGFVSKYLKYPHIRVNKCFRDGHFRLKRYRPPSSMPSIYTIEDRRPTIALLPIAAAVTAAGAAVPATDNSEKLLKRNKQGEIEGSEEVMGTCNEGGLEKKKPRVLCLHGFRTSGEIMSTQMRKWPGHVLERLDLVFADAPFPAEGRSEVEGIFPPPYYEWFQFNKEFTEYRNLHECFAFIEEYMIQHGPFDGLMGFSQGAILSAALAGLQSKGLALTRVPKIKFVVIIGGARFPTDDIADKAYVPCLRIPSLHFLGEMDFLRTRGTKLLEAFVDPCVIHHPKGHTVPRLDEKTEKVVLNFIDKIQDLCHNYGSQVSEELETVASEETTRM